jgi:T5SS/PEP-CTERM-associated repeat protein
MFLAQGAAVVVDHASVLTAPAPNVNISSGSMTLKGASHLTVISGPLTLSSPFASAALTVDGAGTTLTLSNAPLELLGFGDATLNVTNGATITGQGNDLVLGAAASVGFSATTSMLVDSAATVAVRNATLFGAAGSPSTLTIQTSGSQLTASDTLNVVGGTVNVLDNANLTARDINIQQGGKIVVDTGATLTATATSNLSEAVQVGSLGEGTLTLSGKSKGTAVVPVVLGVQAGSKGMMTLAGDGTLWENGDAVIVGYSGTGSLLVQTFAQLSTVGAPGSHLGGVIGSQAGSTGTATVDNAVWDVGGDLQVGASGNGTLIVQSHGRVSNVNAVIGVEDIATGSATVNGEQALWESSGDLKVGAKGRGTLTISKGGQVTSTNGFISADFPATGAPPSAVTVTGAGSAWNNTGNLQIGAKGPATLSIEDGGHVSNQDAIIAVLLEPHDSATVTVTGIDSVWNNLGRLTVGADGFGQLTVENQGKVSAASMVIASGPSLEPSSASFGFGGQLAVSGNLTVGAGGSGVLNVNGTGSVVQVDGTLAVGDSGRGTLNATDGGQLRTSGITQIGGIAAPGEVSVLRGASWSSSGNITVGSAQAPGALTVQSALLVAPQVIVNPFGTLNGQGGHIQAMVINNGGTVTPGDATGTLQITGDYVQNSGTLLFEIDGTLAGEFDQLLVSGKATLNGGTLRIIFGNGFEPVAGESFDLISADLGFMNLGAGVQVDGLSSALRFSDTTTANGFAVNFESAPPVPEPSSVALVVAGLLVLGVRPILSSRARASTLQ